MSLDRLSIGGYSDLNLIWATMHSQQMSASNGVKCPFLADQAAAYWTSYSISPILNQESGCTLSQMWSAFSYAVNYSCNTAGEGQVVINHDWMER